MWLLMLLVIARTISAGPMPNMVKSTVVLELHGRCGHGICISGEVPIFGIHLSFLRHLFGAESRGISLTPCARAVGENLEVIQTAVAEEAVN